MTRRFRRTAVWFRGKDLRVSDHAPLQEAIESSDEVLPVFVIDPYFFDPTRARELPHRMQFLLESLHALSANLEHLGSKLVILRGKAVDEIPKWAATHHINRIVAQRWTEPFARKRDEIVKTRLEAAGRTFELFEGELLHVPGSVLTQSGTPFGVFTPFSKAFLRDVVVEPSLRAPKKLPAVPKEFPTSLPLPTLQELSIEENPQIQKGGEKAARVRLKHFLDAPWKTYATDRDQMGLEGTSRLSADLKFGTLSPREVWNAVQAIDPNAVDAGAARTHAAESKRRYLLELLWREFAHELLWQRPTLLEQPYRADFSAFPYLENEPHWTAWVQGTTGYPVIDAASRQLLAEGYVHNRARMITASFLTKHLLLDYKKGEAHFMKYLTDGDWAQNNMGWQWSAGCGCDAQPYFRVFNPVTQGERFDPEGKYVRRYVPELSKLDVKYIHKPWEASAAVLSGAGIVLGKTYPKPVVDLSFGRDRFLATAKMFLKPGISEQA